MNYKKYLKSREWSKKRRQTTRWHRKKCLVCGDPKVDIHHQTYRRLGRENHKTDLVPLCRKHHFAIHALAKVRGESVWSVTQRSTKRATVDRPKKLWSEMTPADRADLLGPAL